MFRQLAVLTAPADVFLHHPSELAGYLEAVWAMRSPEYEARRPAASLAPMLPAGATLPAIPAGREWHHLIYAYLIESTFIYEIFDRVLCECLNSERLGILSADSHTWIRNTEDLFYKDPPPYYIYSTRSELRPDDSAVRRNAYYRMFGMELPHTMEGNTDFLKPAASNLEFIETFEEFLRKTWIGIVNVNNRIGARPTDDQAVANYARRLREMLLDRRQNGTLAREEFFAVATMSWFHLTVEFNSPIVVSLRAEGTSPEQRLRRIAEKVNLTAHSKADSYFQIAEPVSRILLMIETQNLHDPGNVPILYRPGQFRNNIETVVNHWSYITGRDLKAARVAVSP